MNRLRQNVRTSVAWASAEGIVNVLAALCVTLVVGRIIGPTEFGLAAVAYLLGTFAEIIVYTPFVDPLIQRPRVDRSLLDATFTAMIAVGTGIYLIILIAAPLLAGLYDEPKLAGLLIVQGTTCIFTGLRGVPEAMMSRKLRFSQISIRSIAAKIASTLVSLAGALLGMGAWSIILGNVAFAFGATTMVLAMTKRMPRIAFLPDRVASLASFGMFSLLDALLWTATSRLFCFLVGYFQGIQALGQLTVAYRMNETVCTLVLNVIGRLALPLLSRVADDRRRLEEVYLQGTRLVWLVTAPVFLGLAFTSREIVDLMLGPDWPLASPALVAVCLFSLFNFTCALSQPTVKAVARPSLLVSPNVIALIHITAGSFILRNAGFQAMLWVWMSFGVVYMVCMLRIIQQAIGTHWLTQLKPLASAVLPSLGMCGALAGVGLLNLGLSTSMMLVLNIALGGASYALLLVGLERPLLVQLLSPPAAPIKAGSE
jgi:O-antigen/teichoic acid export membrane protein